MGQYNVSTNTKIDWTAKGADRILQNVCNVLNTFKDEVAYNRNFGRDPSIIDKPISEQIPLLIAETYELIEEYEPRAIINDVEIEIENNEPVIKVVVEIEQ